MEELAYFKNISLSIDSSISTFYSKNPKFKPTGKWLEDAMDTDKNYDFMDLNFLYLENSQEMIVYSFTSESESKEASSYCVLSIRALTKYNKKCDCIYFHIKEDLDSEKIEDITNKMEKLFLNKLGYKYTRIGRLEW